MFMIATIQRIVSGTPTQAGTVWMPTNGNVKRSTQIPKYDGHRRREHLADELLPPAQPAEVVDRTDRDGDRRAEQQAARLAVERQERERRHEDPEEEREPAEPRHRAHVQPPAAGRVDDAEQTGHPADRRRQQHHDDEGHERPPDHLEVVTENLEDVVVGGAEVSRDRDDTHHPTLLRAVEPVSRVAEAGDDVALLVQAAVDRRTDDVHVRMLRRGCSRSRAARPRCTRASR